MPDAHHLGCAGSADLAHGAVCTPEGREATLTATQLQAVIGLGTRCWREGRLCKVLRLSTGRRWIWHQSSARQRCLPRRYAVQPQGARRPELCLGTGRPTVFDSRLPKCCNCSGTARSAGYSSFRELPGKGSRLSSPPETSRHLWSSNACMNGWCTSAAETALPILNSMDEELATHQ
jgi:hypothetical protein